MKKQATNQPNATLKTALRLAFASLFFLNFFTAGAQEAVKNTEPTLQVKYLGLTESQPIFQVDFDNETGATFLLSIKGEDGTTLYTQVVKEKRFSKKIKWENPELDAAKLVFTLSNERSKQTQVVEVNTSMKEYRDVVITKL